MTKEPLKLITLFFIMLPVVLFGQFYPNKLNTKSATLKADSVYFEYIKNSSKENHKVDVVLKNLELNKSKSIETADANYADWLKRASSEDQYSKLEITSFKAAEINTPNLLLLESNYLEYIRIGDKNINKRNELLVAEFNKVNKVSAVELADANYFKIPLQSQQQNLNSEISATDTKPSNNELNTQPIQEIIISKTEIIEPIKQTFPDTLTIVNKENVKEPKSESKTTLTEPAPVAIINKSKSDQSNVQSQSNSKWKTDIPVTEAQQENIKKGFYLVNEGETVYRVSINTNVSTEKIRELNHLTNNNIKPGTKLIISNSISEANKGQNQLNTSITNSKWKTDIPVTESQAENMKNGFYVVNEGETLYRVSVNTNLSIQKLKALNNLKSNNIYPGTKLIIK